jgi:hypothetical protein
VLAYAIRHANGHRWHKREGEGLGSVKRDGKRGGRDAEGSGSKAAYWTNKIG